ncbi:MAG: hypothetical protein ABI977_15045 [Acidobacteriota bacterium]
MKLTTSLTTLSVLVIFGAATIAAALPQQQSGAVPAEKKRAMNKFDPTDLFPEAKEHGRKERNKRDKNSASSLTSNASSAGAEPTSASRKNSRRRRSETTGSAKSKPEMAANASPAPTPATAPQDSPSPNIVMGGAAALTASHPQTLIASNNAPASSSETSLRGQPLQDSWLSLPVILTLLSLVALALIFALAKLRKQLRGSVN